MERSRFVAERLANPTGALGSLTALVWNRRNVALNDTALELLALQPADRVLEIGFGGGYLLDRMAAIVRGGLLAGVDISPTMVRDVEKRLRRRSKTSNLDLKCAPAEALPYPDGHFTKVCSVNSIFYWRDIEKGLREIARVLEVGGQLVLCFTSKESLQKRGFAGQLKLIDPQALAAMLQASGLQWMSTTTHADKHRSYFGMTARKRSPG